VGGGTPSTRGTERVEKGTHSERGGNLLSPKKGVLRQEGGREGVHNQNIAKKKGHPKKVGGVAEMKNRKKAEVLFERKGQTESKFEVKWKRKTRAGRGVLKLGKGLRQLLFPRKKSFLKYSCVFS